MRRSTATATIAFGIALITWTGIALAGNQAIDVVPGTSPGASSATSPATVVDALSAAITAAQEHLVDQPDDHEVWAELGAAYVEQARVSADPSYYPKAEGALNKSLSLNPDGNDYAMTAMGALANARHDFEAGADWARQAQEINPANATTWGVLADSLIQLGDYDGATAAVQQMLDLVPGLPSYTRASYDLELHGQPDRAREALELALSGAFSPADMSFCRYYLGQLAFNAGDLDEAENQFRTGLRAAANDPVLLAGLARVEAARGNEDEALKGYERVVNARPLSEYLVEYGTYLESLGRTEEADEQFSVLEASQLLFESNGGQDDLTAALVEADRGDPAVAVEHAEKEWARRQNVEAADAMAWSLHSAGRNQEALEYAVKANLLEGPNATYLYHQGMIELSLGMDDDARAHLQDALNTNPHFSPLHAPRAQQAINELDETQ